MEMTELKLYLDQKADQYNHPDFIANDPIQIPHRFEVLQDIEISGFLTAVISWGNRRSILTSAEKILSYLDHSPFDFVKNFSESDLTSIRGKSIHRTFNSEDFIFFLNALKEMYSQNESLENLFVLKNDETNFYHAIERFRKVFLESNPENRAKKHLSSTYKNASAKRLMMFLRWMVRHDKRGVDFGIWQRISPEFLSIPLDVHTGNVARSLGIISRKQNDWKTVEEMDKVLRQWNPKDPALYDFALFGIGVSGELKNF